MERRSFLKGALALPLVPGSAWAQAAPGFSRVRPGQPGWPAEASWDGLNRNVGGRLLKLQSSLSVCQRVAERRRLPRDLQGAEKSLLYRR